MSTPHDAAGALPRGPRTTDVDEYVLDDADEIERRDPDGMLREVAAAPAQLREAAYVAREVDVAAEVEAGRPRSVVVAGMGGSGIAGDVLVAVAGGGCPVPVVAHRGYGLPGWVGAADLVVAVSCSGATEETLAAAHEARRRGARLVTVGGVGSPLAELARHAGASHFPVPGGRLPRASVWALSVPLLVIADAVGVCRIPEAAYESAAMALENASDRYRASKEVFLNPAKTMAMELASGLPVVWGSSPLAAVAAYRFAGQVAENAKLAAVWGELPEANHNQVLFFDGEGDRLRLVLLRDNEEHPQVARRVEASAALAKERGIPIGVVTAEGEGPLARLASLIAMADFVSVYLAVLVGTDPSPMELIDELKRRIAE